MQLQTILQCILNRVVIGLSFLTASTIGLAILILCMNSFKDLMNAIWKKRQKHKK